MVEEERGGRGLLVSDAFSASYKRIFKLSPSLSPLTLPLTSLPSSPSSISPIRSHSNSITGGSHLDAARENIILFEQIIPEKGVPVGMRRFLPGHEVDQQFAAVGEVLHVDQLPTSWDVYPS